jgi:hypothetical protein
MKAIRGVDTKSIEDVMPDCVAVLVSELASVGETLIKQQIRQFSSQTDKPGESDVIEFKNLSEMIGKFKYHLGSADEIDLRYWLFNQDLMANTPRYF